MAHQQQLRRRLLGSLACAGAGLLLPRVVVAAGLPAMTAGPFYPSPTWRASEIDWDADLTRVDRASGASASRAAGEWLDLTGSVVDRRGRAVDGVRIEIWQCDVFGSYRHPRGAGARIDNGFQGFGSSVSDAAGRYRFRTIKPAPYPGRTPHIHVLLRHPSWGELTSQLFVAGDPANAGDFLYRSLSAADRDAAALQLRAAPADAEVRWLADRPLIVGA